MNRILQYISLILLIFVFASCGSKTYKSIDYLQDTFASQNVQIQEAPELVIQPKDLLSIIVTTSDPSLLSGLNLSIKAFEAGSASDNISSADQRLLGYFVSDNGEIDFPYLGKIIVSGLTRKQLEQKIKDELSDKGILLNPTVTIEFLNFKISVLGEVAKPGQYALTNEKVSIFQALSTAGDLTIYGRRDNVMVIRESQKNRNVYVLDLTSQKIFDSPAYYLQQQDVVYVCPNNVRAGQSTINENYVRSGGFILSLTSLAVVLTNLFIKIF